MAGNPFDATQRGPGMNARGRGKGGGGGGGGNNRNRNRNKNRNKNKNKKPKNPLVPELPELDATLGLDAPNVGGVGGNASTGYNSLNPFMGGDPYAPGHQFSEANDYEQTFFQEQPQEAFNAVAQTAGMTPGGSDAIGQWLQREYERLFADYNAMRAASPNQDFSWYDYIGNMGDVQYGQPGWAESFNNYLLQRYRGDTMANRGLNDSPFIGQSNWMAF